MKKKPTQLQQQKIWDAAVERAEKFPSKLIPTMGFFWMEKSLSRTESNRVIREIRKKDEEFLKAKGINVR